MLLLVKLAVLAVVTGCAHAILPLEDAKATVNELFTYKLDPKDFPGGVKVQEANKLALPSWLEYDKERNELIGVPTKKDKGTWILTANQEMFAVTVSTSTKLHLAQPIDEEEQTVCNSHDPVTVVYVKINAEVDSMQSKEKAALVSRLSSHLQLKPHHIQVSSRMADLQDTAKALVSGSGDSPANDEIFGVLSWVVGCGPVTSRHVEILEKIESTAKDGSMSGELKKGVSGWQVQSNQPNKMPKRRLKRRVGVTATPTVATSTANSKPDIGTETTPEKPVPPPGNKAPEVNAELVPAHIPAFGGQLVQWDIPERLFVDPEGENMHLSVESLKGEKRWVIMNNKVVGVASPQLNDMDEVLRLTATDEEGLQTAVDVNVRHGAAFNKFTQEYTLKISETDDLKDPISDVFLALTLSRIAPFNELVLSHVMRDGERSVITVVAGDNQGILSNCPIASNKKTLTALRNAVGKTKPLVGVEEGELHIMSIERVQPHSPCEEGKPQVNRRKLGRYKPLRVNLGELYESTIPVNLFTDNEDGDLSGMALHLLVGGIVEANGWISLDEKTRHLQALTWDMPESAAQFTLVARDSSGNTAEEEIEVQVVANTLRNETNLITLIFDGTYSVFANDHNRQIDLYRKVAKAFPDTIVRVMSVKQGSIIFQFSLFPSDEPSPKPAVKECSAEAKYQDIMYDGDKIRESFISALGSYKLERVKFVGTGPCSDIHPPRSVGIQSADREEPPKNNFIIIIIIIVIVVVVIIIIVIVVVCIRKRRAEKAAASRQNNGNDIEKRVPVVMEEEMKSLERPENEPLMTGADESFKTKPPAYPGDDDYQPDTPPLSEPDDERRIIDRSL